MSAWLSQHRAALASALRRLWATPLNTLLSLLVIGIALTLPGFGYVLLDNLRALGGNASGVQQISLFMNLDASRKEVGEIENRLRQAATGKWRFVPKEDALKRMQESEGMADIVASLPRNPLPDAFIVEPTHSEPEALEILRKEIAGWPKVAHVQLDSAWVKRLDAFLALGKLAVWMLAGVFAAGLVAVTFNTIRLQVMAQAAEIEVARMIGATDSFIRRPFHYYGALQGALGGLGGGRAGVRGAGAARRAGWRPGGPLRRHPQPARARRRRGGAAVCRRRAARLAGRAAFRQPLAAEV